MSGEGGQHLTNDAPERPHGIAEGPAVAEVVAPEASKPKRIVRVVPKMPAMPDPEPVPAREPGKRPVRRVPKMPNMDTEIPLPSQQPSQETKVSPDDIYDEDAPDDVEYVNDPRTIRPFESSTDPSDHPMLRTSREPAHPATAAAPPPDSRELLRAKIRAMRQSRTRAPVQKGVPKMGRSQSPASASPAQATGGGELGNTNRQAPTKKQRRKLASLIRNKGIGPALHEMGITDPGVQRILEDAAANGSINNPQRLGEALAQYYLSKSGARIEPVTKTT